MKEVCVSYCIQSVKGEVLESEYFEGEMTIERLEYIMEKIEDAECFGVTMTCVEEGKGFQNVQINKSSVSDSAVFHLNSYNGVSEGDFDNDFFVAPAEDISASVLNALYTAMLNNKKAVIPFYQKEGEQL